MDDIYKTERYQIFLRMTVFFDECYEKFGYENKTLNKIEEFYETQRGYIFNCTDHGHIWENDHCGRPEHQFCSFCGILIDEESLKNSK